MRTTLALCMAALAIPAAVRAAVPQLKGSQEAVGATELKVKTLVGSKMVQALTPKSQTWRFKRGSEAWTETHYDPCEIWRGHECSAMWKDKKGNLLTLATPSAFCPSIGDGHAKREDIDACMAGDADAFRNPTDETLARWASEFSGKSLDGSALSKSDASPLSDVRQVNFGSDSLCAVFFRTPAGALHYAEFKFAQPAKQKEIDGLLKQFLKGVAVDKSKAAGKANADDGVVTEGRWMTVDVPGYRFKTDLPRSQGLAFIKNAGRLMEAMQAAYRRYVPPQRELGVSTVRLFATREGYNEYMQGATGESGERSIGLWSPSHEELLILDMGNSARGETLKTMRHEAFHQYLHYATACGRHAVWFNEGHACFFENVSYDQKKNYVRVFDDPKDRRPAAVASDPERYARLVKEVLSLDHSEFYAGTLREVNDRYSAAWAAVYFLQKGSHAFKEFSDYADVLPAYLEAVKDGKSAQEATQLAWEKVKSRDFVADFTKFWSKRTAARRYEPPEVK